MTCYDFLKKTYDKKKGHIIYLGHYISLNKLIKNIDDFAISLIKLGFKKGDTLTLYLPNCPQALTAFYACSKIGVIANIVHPLTPLEKLKENLTQTNSKGLMYYDILIKRQKSLIGLNQILIKCSITNYIVLRKFFFYIYSKFKTKSCKEALSFTKLIRHSQKDYKEYAINTFPNKNTIVCTMHSGGTSGCPKIVALQNKAFNELSISLEKMYTRKIRGGGSEYALVCLPLFHAYGLGVCVHTCLTNQYSLILMPNFCPKKIIKQIKTRNVTFFAGVPIMFKKLLENKKFAGRHLKKLQDLWCGGDVLNEAFVEHFDIVLKENKSPARLLRGYGLTETCSVCSVNTIENYRKNSCGKAIPGTKIEIWDEENNSLKNYSVGEIVVNSPSLMKYYIDDKDGFVFKNEEKWIKTGDLGYLDKNGFLYVLDRKKRSIKINAMNIFPSEIENTAKLNQNVDEACAIFYHYDEKTYVKLFVTLKDKELNVNVDKIKKDILLKCKQNLLKYAVPRIIEVIDEMPRTNFGKIDYKKFSVI